MNFFKTNETKIISKFLKNGYYKGKVENKNAGNKTKKKNKGKKKGHMSNFARLKAKEDGAGQSGSAPLRRRKANKPD